MQSMTTKITAMAVVLAMAGMVQAASVTYTGTASTTEVTKDGVSVAATLTQFDNGVGGAYAGDV